VQNDSEGGLSIEEEGHRNSRNGVPVDMLCVRGMGHPENSYALRNWCQRLSEKLKTTKKFRHTHRKRRSDEVLEYKSFREEIMKARREDGQTSTSGGGGG
jgi:hypothetical protein